MRLANSRWLPPRAFTSAPDGGWGWVVAAGSFAIHFVILGTQYSFGVLYAALLADPTMLTLESRAEGAWVGSIATACMLGGGIVVSVFVRRFGARVTSAVGSCLVGAGLLSSSFATSVGVLYVTYGLLCGCGMALSFISAVIIVGQYFTRRRSSATGLAVSGSGIGTFAFAAINERLIAQFGWRVCLRIDALICFVCVAIAAATFVPVILSASSADPPTLTGAISGDTTIAPGGLGASTDGGTLLRENVDIDDSTLVPPKVGSEAGGRDDSAKNEAIPVEHLTSVSCQDGADSAKAPAVLDPRTQPPQQPDAPDAILLTRAQLYGSRPFLQFMACSVLAGAFSAVLPHLPVFIGEQGHSRDMAAWVVAGSGIASSVGRVVFGRIADLEAVDSIYLLQGSMAVAAASVAGLAFFGGSVAYLALFAVLYGGFSGAVIAMSPPLYADVMGVRNMPAALGASYTVQLPSALLFSPAVGLLREATGGYTAPWLILGGILLASALTITGLPRRFSDWHRSSSLEKALAPAVPPVVLGVLLPEDASAPSGMR